MDNVPPYDVTRFPLFLSLRNSFVPFFLALFSPVLFFATIANDEVYKIYTPPLLASPLSFS